VAEETKPYKRGINPDTASVDEIHRADDRLVGYIENAGLSNAAAVVQEIIDKPNEVSSVESQKDPNTVKILSVQRKILEVLEKIEAEMIDEQDTSIKHSADESNFNRLNGTTKLVSEASGSSSTPGGVGDLAGLLGLAGLAGKGKRKKDSKKVSLENKTHKTPKRTPNKMSKFPNVLGKLGKGALRFMRFAGPVGIAITAGLAISDGLDGWDNAAEELGMDGELSVGNKASAALGAVVSGISFGRLDSANLSKGINNATGGNKTVEKYEKEGILDHEIWGDSEITDWKKLSKLNAQEIQKIIDIDDWSDSVRERLEVLKTTAQAMIEQSRKAAVPAKGLLEPTPKSEDVKAVKYTMKTIPMVPVKGSPDVLISANKTSTEPSSYTPSDLFKLYNVKNSDFDSMNPAMLSNLKSMAAEYRDLFGESIQINSAYRSVEEQKELKHKFGSKAAEPGYSMHNYGLAVDMNTVNADNATAAGLFTKYGFKRPVRGETWHVEPKGIDRKKIREEGVQALSMAVQTTVSKSAESVHQTPDVKQALKEGESVKDVVYKQDKPASGKITNASDELESSITTKHISPELPALMDLEEPPEATKRSEPKKASLKSESADLMEEPPEATKRSEPKKASLKSESADLMEEPPEATNIRKYNEARLNKEEHRDKSGFMNVDNYDLDYVVTTSDKKAKIKARDDAKLAMFKDKTAEKSQFYSDVLAEDKSKKSHSTAVPVSPVKKTSGFRNLMDSSDDFTDDATTVNSNTAETNSFKKSTPLTHTQSMSVAEIAAAKKGVEEFRKHSDHNSPSLIRMRSRSANKKSARAAQLAEANKVPKERVVSEFSNNLTKETVKFKTPQVQNVANDTHTTQTNVINTEQIGVRSLELFSN